MNIIVTVERNLDAPCDFSHAGLYVNKAGSIYFVGDNGTAICVKDTLSDSTSYRGKVINLTAADVQGWMPFYGTIAITTSPNTFSRAPSTLSQK